MVAGRRASWVVRVEVSVMIDLKSRFRLLWNLMVNHLYGNKRMAKSFFTEIIFAGRPLDFVRTRFATIADTVRDNRGYWPRLLI